MRSTTYTQKAIDALLKNSLKNNFIDSLPLPMAGNCTYTPKRISSILLFAVSEDTYVEYAAEHLQTKKDDVSSSDAVFYHLNKLTSNTVYSTFKQINTSLLSQAHHQGVFKHPIHCGLDIHKIPWYGETRDIHVLGMERIRGTNFGHGYASIECVNARERFTLAALPLTQFTTKKQIITSLVQETINHADLSLLFLDREFFDVESLTTLMSIPLCYVIPADHNTVVKKIILS